MSVIIVPNELMVCIELILISFINIRNRLRIREFGFIPRVYNSQS